MNITYYNGSTDAYSGQVNMEAAIYVDEQIVGAAEYVLYDGELTISHIYIKPEWRRKGMGSRLIKYIKQENPEYKYLPSLKTDLGAAFVHKEVHLEENKLVRESLDFERGLDPKDSMGLGREALKLSKYEKLNADFERDFNGFYYRETPDIVRYWGKEVKTVDYVKVKWSSPETKKKIKEWFKKYHPDFRVLSLKKNWSPMGSEYYLNFEWIPNSIKESLDFERGKDPKKSMGIGREFYSKEIYDQFIKDLKIAFPDLQTTFLKEDPVEGYYIELPLDPYSEEGMNLLDRITRKVIREKYKGKLVFVTENFLEKYYKGEFPDESPFYGEEDLMIKIL